MNIFSTNLPEDKALVSTYYSEIRTMQEDIRDRFILDHYIQSTLAGAADNDGYHKQLTLADNYDASALTNASVLYATKILGQSELVHKNETYTTPITYGDQLNYDTTQKTATSSYTFTGTSYSSIALTNTSTSYNFDSTIVFDHPTVCLINMTASGYISDSVSVTTYTPYYAVISINPVITRLPSIICEGISLSVKPIMLLYGTCIFRHRFAESNIASPLGFAITDDRRLSLSASTTIIYNGV